MRELSFIVKGSTTLNGTLDAQTINGYTPPTGATYDVLTYGSRNGSFVTINGHGRTYSANYGAHALMLTAGQTRISARASPHTSVP